MSLVVRGGKVLDPASGTQDVLDIVIDWVNGGAPR